MFTMPHFSTSLMLLFYSFFLICLSIVKGTLQAQSAISFLTWRPTSDTIHFIHDFATNLSSFDIFLIIDDYQFSNNNINSSLIQTIQFDDTICNQHEYINANRFGSNKTCSAWDKALYFFSKQSIHHQFVWFIEEDVFIPATDAFLAVHELYSHNHDLIVPDVNYIIDGSTNRWFHGPLIMDAMVLPWSYGMVCAMGASRKLLSEVDQFVQWRGHLVFIEFLFHTIVLHNPQMKVVAPTELSTILYRKYYSLLIVQTAPNNWWHPVKNIALQRQWRASLMNRTTVHYDTFLQNLQSIEKRIDQLHTNKSFYDLVHDLDILTIQFRSIQAQVEPMRRYQLRERFLHLSINQNEPVRKKIIHLANTAFKLPEDRTDVYSSDARERWGRLNNSSILMEMFAMLEVNKRTVIESLKTKATSMDEMVTVRWLRDESIRLVYEINQQIICDLSMIQCNRTRKWFEWHIAIHRSRPSNSLDYLFVLSMVLLCLFILLHISLNKRRITQRG